MFVLTILEEIKETRLKISLGSVTVLKKKVSSEEARVQLTNKQLNKLKSAAKYKTDTILRITKKNFQVEKLCHELFLTKRQATKTRNAFANNMSTDMKLTKAQISKTIQSGWFLGFWLNKLGKKVVTALAIPFACDKLTAI